MFCFRCFSYFFCRLYGIMVCMRIENIIASRLYELRGGVPTKYFTHIICCHHLLCTSHVIGRNPLPPVGQFSQSPGLLLRYETGKRITTMPDTGFEPRTPRSFFPCGNRIRDTQRSSQSLSHCATMPCIVCVCVFQFLAISLFCNLFCTENVS